MILKGTQIVGLPIITLLDGKKTKEKAQEAAQKGQEDVIILPPNTQQYRMTGALGGQAKFQKKQKKVNSNRTRKRV